MNLLNEHISLFNIICLFILAVLLIVGFYLTFRATRKPKSTILYVDSINGCDRTGRPGDLKRRFKTIEGALRKSKKGSMVYVFPGVYEVKSGKQRPEITIHFSNEASVSLPLHTSNSNHKSPN